jgi:transposase
MRNERSDYEWAAIKPMLPNKQRGVRRANDRRKLASIRIWLRANGSTPQFINGPRIAPEAPAWAVCPPTRMRPRQVIAIGQPLLAVAPLMGAGVKQ